eukprot:m.175782 g.175782  ORF g.175782 m.175782 type:complete len:425 (+) comp39132_c0_seq10:1021-2295(+)
MLSKLFLVIAGSFCAFSTPFPYKFISGKDVSNASASWMPANMSCSQSVFSVYCPMPMLCNETIGLCQCCSVQEQSGPERQSMTFCSLDFWKGRDLYDPCFVRTSSEVQLYCESKKVTDLHKKTVDGRSCSANETCRILRLWNESDPSPPRVEIGCVGVAVAEFEPTVEPIVEPTGKPTDKPTVEPTDKPTVEPTTGATVEQNVSTDTWPPPTTEESLSVWGIAGTIIGLVAFVVPIVAFLVIIMARRKKRQLPQIVEYKLQPKPIDYLDGNIPSLRNCKSIKDIRKSALGALGRVPEGTEKYDQVSSYVNCFNDTHRNWRVVVERLNYPKEDIEKLERCSKEKKPCDVFFQDYLMRRPQEMAVEALRHLQTLVAQQCHLGEGDECLGLLDEVIGSFSPTGSSVDSLYSGEPCSSCLTIHTESTV